MMITALLKRTHNMNKKIIIIIRRRRLRRNFNNGDQKYSALLILTPLGNMSKVGCKKADDFFAT